MLFKDLPTMYLFLKKKTKSNYLMTSDSNNVFFAFTSKAIEDVILNKYSSFIKDGGFKRLKSILGDGLLTGEEPGHMNNKKEISPAFHNAKIREYEDKMSSTIDFIISSWDEEVNVRKEMKKLVFKSVMDIFFSESMDEEFLKIEKHISIASDKVAFDINDDELKESTRILKEFSKKIVDKRLESKEVKQDFMGTLVNSYNNNKLDLDAVYDEAITILLSSYEATAHVLEWAVYYLSINKDWQEKISNEENVDAFISEVLRMCPPIWNSERLALEDVNIDGTDITAGTKIIVSSLVMHRDENIFEDPDLFKPERWLENKDLSKGEYFPFLFGKRQCVGKEFSIMETKILLTKIAKKFNIELVNNDVTYIAGLTYRPKDEIIIYATIK